MAPNKPQNPHAILVAYPLQGHLIPSVHLAFKLASRGLTITFVNTQFIHHQISAGTLGDAAVDIFAGVRESGLDIRYATVSDGLPLGFDRSLNHDQFMYALLHVFSAHVEEAVRKAVTGAEPPVWCLIADTFFVWPSAIANKFGLLYVSFWTEPALVFSLYYHVDLLRKNGHLDCNDKRQDAIEYIPGVQSLKPTDLTSYLQEKDTSTVCHQIIFRAFEDAKGADLVLCNTVEELEQPTISGLSPKIPFYAIGPLFPTGFTKSPVATSLWPESACTDWLDPKPPGSVLYVSFGSYAHVTRPDLLEVAYGLSLSGVSFVWVLREDIVSSGDVDLLPARYREEVRDRAIIVPWCCQIEVLRHKAIGGFLTHCGWNSILESVWCGVPLLCFPLLTDQFTNRKLVVDDWKIGLDLSDWKAVDRNEASRKISRLMNDGSSRSNLMKKIEKVRTSFENALTPDGSSEKNFSSFIENLKTKLQTRS